MTKKQIGNYIKECRIAQGWKKKPLCDKINIRTTALLDIEEGRTNYTIDTFVKVCEALNIDFEKLKENER
jgi:transcriptional regulator with XRE-family HTH domain